MLKAFLLIVVGLAGDPEHGKTFHKWGTTLAQASERLGVASENLAFLVDAPGEGDQKVTGKDLLALRILAREGKRPDHMRRDRRQDPAVDLKLRDRRRG